MVEGHVPQGVGVQVPPSAFGKRADEMNVSPFHIILKGKKYYPRITPRISFYAQASAQTAIAAVS
jgi:hypothetical protein